jgi:hypothetical protein
MKFFLIILALMPLASGASGAPVKSDSRGLLAYSSLETGVQIYIDLGQREVSEGDLVLPMTLCKQSSKYICISSKPFKFAVPRDATELAPTHGPLPIPSIGKETDEATHPSKSWAFEGQTYRLINPAYEVPMFGRRLKVAVIEVKHVGEGENWYIRYYYSPSAGLLGFMINDVKNPQNTRLYVLDGMVGFGAQKAAGSTTGQ